MSEEEPVNRRRFFREGLRELFRPLVRSIEPLERVAQQLGELEAQASQLEQHEREKHPGVVALRPPGSLDEAAFTATCQHNGECVKVCPVQCIELDTTDNRGGGFPFIDASVKACIVCDGLNCMHVCPSGAIRVISRSEIDMGTARWDRGLCIRSFGSSCTICIDKCPIGQAAIRANGEAVEVIEDGCVGCGLCQQYCPTDPKSILVVPKNATMA